MSYNRPRGTHKDNKLTRQASLAVSAPLVPVSHDGPVLPARHAMCPPNGLSLTLPKDTSALSVVPTVPSAVPPQNNSFSVNFATQPQSEITTRVGQSTRTAMTDACGLDDTCTIKESDPCTAFSSDVLPNDASQNKCLPAPPTTKLSSPDKSASCILPKIIGRDRHLDSGISTMLSYATTAMPSIVSLDLQPYSTSPTQSTGVQLSGSRSIHGRLTCLSPFHRTSASFVQDCKHCPAVKKTNGDVRHTVECTPLDDIIDQVPSSYLSSHTNDASYSYTSSAIASSTAHADVPSLSDIALHHTTPLVSSDNYARVPSYPIVNSQVHCESTTKHWNCRPGVLSERSQEPLIHPFLALFSKESPDGAINKVKRSSTNIPAWKPRPLSPSVAPTPLSGLAGTRKVLSLTNAWHRIPMSTTPEEPSTSHDTSSSPPHPSQLSYSSCQTSNSQHLFDQFLAKPGNLPQLPHTLTTTSPAPRRPALRLARGDTADSSSANPSRPAWSHHDAFRGPEQSTNLSFSSTSCWRADTSTYTSPMTSIADAGMRRSQCTNDNYQEFNLKAETTFPLSQRTEEPVTPQDAHAPLLNPASGKPLDCNTHSLHTPGCTTAPPSSVTPSLSSPALENALSGKSFQHIKGPVRLFVNRIPKWMSNAELRTIFAPFGDLIDCSILKGPTGPKGCAFVEYASFACVQAAILSLHGKRVLNAEAGPVQIKYADGELARLGLPNDIQPGGEFVKLFVGSLPRSTTEDEVRKLFSLFGHVDEVHILRDTSRRPKCSAFVTFPKAWMAASAIAALNKRYIFKNSWRPIEVRHAKSKNPRQLFQQPLVQSSRQSDQTSTSVNHDVVEAQNPSWLVFQHSQHTIGNNTVFPTCSSRHAAVSQRQNRNSEQWAVPTVAELPSSGDITATNYLLESSSSASGINVANSSASGRHRRVMSSESEIQQQESHALHGFPFSPNGLSFGVPDTGHKDAAEVDRFSLFHSTHNQSPPNASLGVPFTGEQSFQTLPERYDTGQWCFTKQHTDSFQTHLERATADPPLAYPTPSGIVSVGGDAPSVSSQPVPKTSSSATYTTRCNPTEFDNMLHLGLPTRSELSLLESPSSLKNDNQAAANPAQPLYTSTLHTLLCEMLDEGQ